MQKKQKVVNVDGLGEAVVMKTSRGRGVYPAYYIKEEDGTKSYCVENCLTRGDTILKEVFVRALDEEIAKEIEKYRDWNCPDCEKTTPMPFKEQRIDLRIKQVA